MRDGVGVSHVGTHLRENVQQSADVDLGPERGEVVAVEGLDRQGTEAGNAEEGLQQQRAGEQARNGHHDVR